MPSYSSIDLGTPYFDPISPLYRQSLRSSHTISTTSTSNPTANMTRTSQLSPDYFSHKPRSFLSLHTDFDEKLAAAQSPSPSHDRGRRQSRLVGYDQPTHTVVSPSPRVPRSRTLIRFLVLLIILGLVSLGWRCEAVGCKGRGGGALVGENIASSRYIGGGSVVAGWGTPEGMDLSQIWDRPSWGGERQGADKKEGGSTTLGAFKDEGGEALYGFRDEEGELVGPAGVNGDGFVQWDDEDRQFGAGELDAGGEQTQEGEATEEQRGEVEYELYKAPLVGTIDGPVGEMTGPAEGDVKDGAVNTLAQPDAVSDTQPEAQQDDHQAYESATLARKGSWPDSMNGLW
ncbi:uncharacterized protein M421DRAFT_8422 [Didymella exigua CBS 183.55]|uniref:Uncharacterized protein n=1 Tax=Didymella exigua CBS 183.55 TaxID=1150837 RepID=A0A6A5RCG1_9PLEO|nr:uncharacterized protein M421DRAFT_8422 [Didymella exigua CBS 183.55]KAF1924764.1 hypothetical protein M421DRAFT_8422 [Didymella exigua CBS 183.55]